MPAQERLSREEQYLAYLIGGGITLSVIALMLMAFGTVENTDYTNSLLVTGLAFTILGIGAWLYLLRPWKRFDDLTTPHYVGHDEHAETPALDEAETPPFETIETVKVGDAIPTGQEVPAPVTPPAEVPPAVELQAGEAPPAPVPASEVVTPDDLTLIEGIGPRTAQALAAAGITRFAQIAEMTPEQLIEAARAHGARPGKADTWPAQARRIMFGDLSAVADAQKRIVRGEQHDDLTQIEGIGPKSQQVLYAAGITTFAELAATTPEQLRVILDSAGLRLLNVSTWPEQANLILHGDLSGLKALQDRLKRGRHVQE